MNRILLVEDDVMISEGLRFALEKEKYEVEHAETVKEALDLFTTKPFQLLLLDVRLPDGSGFDICRTVRLRSRVPILFLTASDEEVNVVQGLEIGGDDYITKPFRVKELMSRIKVNLRRSEIEVDLTSAEKLVSGPISVHPFENRVFKSGTAIELTQAEFKLLVLFLRHPGQTLTREQLLDRLDDELGEFFDDNTLSVYIRRLREKLEERPSNPAMIMTVRGVGYKWERSNNYEKP